MGLLRYCYSRACSEDVSYNSGFSLSRMTEAPHQYLLMGASFLCSRPSQVQPSSQDGLTQSLICSGSGVLGHAGAAARTAVDACS